MPPVRPGRARHSAALVVVVGTVASIGVAAAPPAGAANWAPVHSSDFPDPSTMEWLGVYYSFATQNFAAPSQTINIQAATSLDGTNWRPWAGAAVLPHVGAWAKPGNTWAPSVVRDNADNNFVMYYTATEPRRPASSQSGTRTPKRPPPSLSHQRRSHPPAA